MILIPKLFDDFLKLIAYSYSDGEIAVLNLFLRDKDFDYSSYPVNPDRANRKGVEFRIDGRLQITRFEDLLGIKFSSRLQKTSVEFDKGAGKSYRCIRLKHMPWQNGCMDITATDDHSAFIKCSLIANKHNWFGADSEQGSCKHK